MLKQLCRGAQVTINNCTTVSASVHSQDIFNLENYQNKIKL